MSAVCGIDFGTSNSTLTLADERGVRPIVVDPENRLPQAIPTIFFFDDDGLSTYGSKATRDYVEGDHFGRLLQSIKVHLPSSSFQGTMIDGRFRSVEELVAGFLEHLRFMAEQETGAPVTQVVLGRPAVFHEDPVRDKLAQDRLERAASMAGFADVGFQIEPMAAARAFESTLDREVCCLVGDLGGGTSDFTLVRLGPDRVGGDRTGDVLGAGGLSIAGNDLDARLVWQTAVPQMGVESRYRVDNVWAPVPTFLHHTACRWQHLCLADNDENERFLERLIRTSDDPEGIERLRMLIQDQHAWTFFRAIEDVKLDLSRGDRAKFHYDREGLVLRNTVSREQFDHAIRRETTKLEAALDGLLDKTGFHPDDVDVVFLTGGTSLVPRVRAIFEHRFAGRIADHDTFTSVGLGLAIEARERFLG